MSEIITDDFETQEYKINLGPQHPSTHGVFHAILTLNGEYVVKCENDVGFLHRGIEKLAESRTFPQYTAYTAHLDYLAAALNNWAYVAAVEKHMGIQVPERAEYIRVIIGELQRIASHLVMLSSMAIDVNAVTGWMYGFEARDQILDMIEMASGSRMSSNYFTIGGVTEDLPEEFFPALERVISKVFSSVNDFDNLMTGNEIFHGRTKGIGIITQEQVFKYGLTGPNIRAAGINFDLRKKAPYSVYDKLDFEVPLLKNGDTFDRYYIRILEIHQSIKIIEQAAYMIPDGPVSAKVPRIIKPQKGESYCQIEGAKGLLGYYLVSDEGTKPYRLHVHSPSFVNIGILPEIAKGLTVQDLVVTLASLDICLGEIDR